MRCVNKPVCSKMGSRAGKSASGMCSGALLWKLTAGHLGKRATEGFDRPADVVHKLRAGTHQSITRADDCHMSLGILAPVFEWVKELGIHSSQASQVFGIYLIRFALVCVDEPQLPCVGRQDLVATLL